MPREIGISVSVFVPGLQLRSLAVVVPLYNRRISICRQFGIGPGSFLRHSCHLMLLVQHLEGLVAIFSISWSYCQHWPFLVNFHSPLAITGQLFEISQIVNAFNEEGTLGCFVIKRVGFLSPNLVTVFVNHQIW